MNFPSNPLIGLGLPEDHMHSSDANINEHEGEDEGQNDEGALNAPVDNSLDVSYLIGFAGLAVGGYLVYKWMYDNE